VTGIDLPKENYIPPHPQQGTPYHRYTILALQNPDGKELQIDTDHYINSRDNFATREFCDRYGLSLDRRGPGGGVFMWREVWDETVSDIYQNTLSESIQCHLLGNMLIAYRIEMEEPRYGKTPKFDMYAEVKEMKRYL
jgi:large subunit ribosomal protein L35